MGVVTLPFSGEGAARMEQARDGLERLRRVCDTTIVIQNDKLLELVPRMPLDAAFKLADAVLMTGIKGITEIVTRPGLVNLDYADIMTVMKDGGVALIGLGESESATDRVTEAVTEALTSPLLGSVELKDATGALVRVIGGPTMTVSEAEKAAALVGERSPSAPGSSGDARSRTAPRWRTPSRCSSSSPASAPRASSARRGATLPVSPRKSSTSSAEPVSRPRYLGVEVVGEPFVPRPWLEETLRRTLPAAPAGSDRGPRRLRIVRLERSKALVEVGHRWAIEARTAWNVSVPGPSGSPVVLTTRQTWGTLRGGKLWLRRRA